MGYDVSSLSTEDFKRTESGCKKRKYKNALIQHSDRGLDYCSNDYQAVLNKKNIPSITKNSDVNAERVNDIIKTGVFTGRLSSRY